MAPFTSLFHTELAVLARHISQRRDAIVQSWYAAVLADPGLTKGASLPRVQLHDHIPALLEDYERRLLARDAEMRLGAEDSHEGDAAAHGLHRWQQGFDLSEVTRELGRFNECVVAELDRYAAALATREDAAMAMARQIWAQQHSAAVSTSASQYFKLQQLEVSSHITDLELALETLRELEQQRAELWQQAAHDLRGNLGGVMSATACLTSTSSASELARDKFLNMLDRNVASLQHLLADVTSLARLQGGLEQRNVASMDAAQILRELCEGLQPQARLRQLFLRFDGPAALRVQGDAVKVRRIVQNLALNALKYTHQGGVVVSWGDSTDNDAGRWFAQVQDSGPGFSAGPGSPLVGALEVATEQADDVETDGHTGQVTHVSADDDGLPEQGADRLGVHQQMGEGIGLSIVKRLCELLDATIELSSQPNEGTTFRILLPRLYG